MTSLTLNQQSCTINVPFHGAELYVVNHNGEPFTPMKPIVDGMGMDWKSQYVKLTQRFAKGVVEITIPTAGGIQKMICLALRKLAAWLNTISPNKVKPEIRDRVIQYQDECDDVLYDYWTKGQVTNPRKTSTDERTPLRGVVNRIMGKYGMTYQAVYKMVHKEFGVKHIDELSAKQTAEAIEYLAGKVIEGEFIGKETLPPVKPQFTDDELISLCYLQLWMEKSQRVSQQLYPAMKQAKSEYAGVLYDIAHDIRYITEETKKLLLREAQALDSSNIVVKHAQPMLAMLRGEEWIH
ncbi:phage antirepressor Ant [Salmonella enterica]|nr:phage antirepressor Ant [Salmonella enterica subsp. enterica serovar Oranienburg]EGU0507269.1 phage antirepressor Ant [Salmonella enterica]EHT8772606.1 phage antirepressor Ant [Salmonella enterica]EHZ3033094.1 phage antirepressor Ant [Salmonella enterica subsp. enterica serovar Oranienburg]EIL5910902.1 phage antirepressor Ant [Salmonella enterica]